MFNFSQFFKNLFKHSSPTQTITTQPATTPPLSLTLAPVTTVSAPTITSTASSSVSTAPVAVPPPYPPNLPPGYEYLFFVGTGKWEWTYTGIGVDNPKQRFIDAGGNIGQYAAFDIFVQNEKLQDKTFLEQYNLWLQDLKRSDAELVKADAQGDFGEGWRTFVSPGTGPIDKEFNSLMKNKGPNWAYNYVAYASPNWLATRMGHDLGTALFTCFGFATRSESIRKSLHLGADEGYAGVPSIEGTNFIISTSFGQSVVPLIYGGQNFHNTPDPYL